MNAINAANVASIKIALIAPEPGDVAWIEGLVRDGDAVADVTDAMAAERPDIAGAELILIGLQELGLVEKEALTRLHEGFPGTPMIVLAGPGLAGRAGEAVGLGAQHVTSRDELTPVKLSSLIRYYAGYVRQHPGGLIATA